MIPLWLQLVALIGSPLFAAGGAYMAVKTRLDWHDQRLDAHETRLNRHDDLLMR